MCGIKDEIKGRKKVQKERRGREKRGKKMKPSPWHAGSEI